MTYQDDKTVFVRQYQRIRFDKLEDVTRHWRRPPR